MRGALLATLRGGPAFGSEAPPCGGAGSGVDTRRNHDDSSTLGSRLRQCRSKRAVRSCETRGTRRWPGRGGRPRCSPRTRCRRLCDQGSAGCCSEGRGRSEEHTSELQSRLHLVCRLLLEKK